MRITARPVHDHPVELVAAPNRRAWMGGDGDLFADPTLQAATGRGWELHCPYSFEAVWNGGPAPEDVEISAPGFVTSQAGHGILTFRTGYQFELEAGHHLWVRGPVNHLKHGIQPLDQVIEADLLPYLVTVNWRFTAPGEVVRFERGEPFATILPYPVDYVERFQGEIVDDAPVELPGISCICPTFGRPALLEEAIESFLRQEYRGPKELIVLNDLDRQTLIFEHPDVRVINVPGRFRSLGEKLNAAVGLCSYDLIAVWFDDDISLPHRLALSVRRLDPKRGFFKASTALFLDGGLLSGPDRNVFHGGSLWTRELFVAARGYPHRTVGVDQAIEQQFAMARLDAVTATDLLPAENYYIYRWNGTNSFHVSALEQGNPDPSAAYAAAARYVDEQLRGGHLPTGRIELHPRWHRAYADDARLLLEEQAAVPADGRPRTNGAVRIGANGEVTEPAELPDEPIVFGNLPRPVPPAEALALFQGTSAVPISVILPACNEYPKLQRTLEQFQASLPAGSEIIVVDNGSTDGTSDFLAATAVAPASESPEPVRCQGGDETSGVAVWLLRYAKPLGVSGARNRGLDHARGEVVVFSDAHNDIPPGWWPPMVAALNQPQVGLVGPAFGIMGVSHAPRSCGQRIVDAQLRVEWLPFRQIDPHPVPTLGGGFMAMRHEVLRAAGSFDDGMPQWGSEDLEICLRYWLLGYEVWVVPEVEIPHYFRSVAPYRVEYVHVLHNLLRTAMLHLNEERLAHVLHAFMQHPMYARAMALCVASDAWARRDALRARRAHDDDWYFAHPAFREIEMGLRDVTATPAV